MTLLGELTTRMHPELMARFDREAAEEEHGRFEGEMMVYLWFRAEVSAWGRRRALTILQKALDDRRPSGGGDRL